MRACWHCSLGAGNWRLTAAFSDDQAASSVSARRTFFELFARFFRAGEIVVAQERAIAAVVGVNEATDDVVTRAAANLAGSESNNSKNQKNQRNQTVGIEMLGNLGLEKNKNAGIS